MGEWSHNTTRYPSDHQYRLTRPQTSPPPPKTGTHPLEGSTENLSRSKMFLHLVHWKEKNNFGHLNVFFFFSQDNRALTIKGPLLAAIGMDYLGQTTLNRTKTDWFRLKNVSEFMRGDLLWDSQICLNLSFSGRFEKIGKGVKDIDKEI